MKRISVIMLMFIALNIFSQEKLSLEQCYTLAEKNYPLAKQNDLLLKQNTIDLEIINIEKLPKLDFLVQASYQSDVTSLPFSIPVTTVEPPNKDQYKATVSINQLIYDGGFINASLTEKSTSLKTQQKQVEVNLYRLKEQVNQFYFSILLLQEKSALLLAKKKQLETTLNEVKAGIKFGVLLPNSDSILQAELLKIDQQLMEVGLNKTSLMTTLYMLIGIPVSQNIIFDNPEINTKLNHEIERPELELFQLQKENIDASEQLIDKKNSPKLSGFATGGYGNPGLNMLDNSFQTYYIAGIKLNWNVFDWNSTKKQRQSLQVNKEIIDSEQEVFELNTAMELTQQQSEINKISAFIASDEEIIALRKKILETSRSQLKNGVITSSAYVTELTNLFEAENNLSTHRIQLQFAKANYNTTKGF
ncbi:MAG: TolC family protein [Flavobacteriales bacterium CG_4_10_14_0_2_um_filter_35_18]|nr:MAG: TolC family protein [Flavobacteriales bacterium CG_4_10_14_0_2_um_filter_35_18]